MGLFDRLKKGLSKTSGGIGSKITAVLTGRNIDEDMFEDLEEALIEADMGIATSMELIEELRRRVKTDKIKDGDGLKATLLDEICKILQQGQKDWNLQKGTLQVILVTGVNGVGKTTSIGKMASRLKGEGFQVLLCAADTFRAAAAEQLSMWAERAEVEIIRHHEGADPGAVVFDGIQAAKSRKVDLLMIDTAGRLQNKNNLMAELGKIKRILDKELPDAPLENLLVLDASTGQNAISQAKAFKEIVDINGIILTKIDGTAKGGIIAGIIDEMKIPIRYVGVGEGIEDLQDFDGEAFGKALFQKNEEE